MEIALFRLSISVRFNLVTLYVPTEIPLLSQLSSLFEWSWTMEDSLPMGLNPLYI